MRGNHSTEALESQAMAALQTLLAQVSTIKLEEMRHLALAHSRGLLALVRVLGHSYTLACEVQADARPQRLPAALQELMEGVAGLGAEATPMVIAPRMSTQAQEFCKRNNTCFLDLDGNARLALGEVFIGKRTVTHRGARRTQKRFLPAPAAMENVASRARA